MLNEFVSRPWYEIIGYTSLISFFAGAGFTLGARIVDKVLS